MRRNSNRVFIGAFLFLSLLVSACSPESSNIKDQNGITGQYENKEAVSATKELLMDNLHYAENEDIEGYLSTIPTEAHGDTREAMEAFFKEHTISHKLLEFEVVKEFENEIVVKTKQESIGQNDSGESDYKNHVAEVLHVFKKEENQWKITESSVTNVIFLDE